VLVACEESQEVCKAFRARGHEAYSCDLQECSGGHPEWHIKGDCLPLLNGNCEFVTCGGGRTMIDKWDLIIAHPPCTKTSNAGAKHLWKGHKLNIPRYYEGLCGKALFMAILEADCRKIVVENPVPSAIFDFPKPTQIIQPYEYGHPVSKKTLLWEKGVEPLKPTNIVEPTANCHEAGTWFMKGGKERQKNRAKTFPGIARAMAEQWGKEG
jgi:hypothetical protein